MNYDTGNFNYDTYITNYTNYVKTVIELSSDYK